MLIACRYGGVNVNCMDIFNSVLTDSGLCCIFNGVHRKFLMNMSYKLYSHLLHFFCPFDYYHDDYSHFSRSENFGSSDTMERMANIWTPESGFQSKILKEHKDGYPRASLGNLKL